jgi:AcrR family transcriptional regulator
MTKHATARPRSGAGIDVGVITTIALDLFNDSGYDGTSMEQIASRLGVTKAAIYYHVPGGKEEILHHAIRRVMDPLWLSLQEPPAVDGTAFERLTHVLGRQVELILHGMPDIAYFLHPKAHHPLSSEVRARRRSYDGAVQSVLDAAIAEGAIRRDVDARLMLRLVVGMIYSMNEWYQPDGRLTIDEIRDGVLALLLTGVTRRSTPS